MLSNPMKEQTQPDGSSCVCTCLAMLMDKPAKEVIEKYHQRYYVDQNMDVADILAENAFIFRRELAGTVQRLLPGAVYLLTVASLNIPGGLHQILLDYRDATKPVVLDPAKRYKGRKYYTLDSIEADETADAFVLFSWIVDYTITASG